jgi:hypothetical protein
MYGLKPVPFKTTPPMEFAAASYARALENLTCGQCRVIYEGVSSS